MKPSRSHSARKAPTRDRLAPQSGASRPARAESSPMGKIARQREFLRRCALSVQPIEEILDDLGVSPEVFNRWADEREFKSRLHNMRRFLRRARDLQLDASSLRAASLIARFAVVDKEDSNNHLTRAACVDIIRLARDSRARRRAGDAEEIGKRRLLSHPDLGEEEAIRLTAELSAEGPDGTDAAAGDADAAEAPGDLDGDPPPAA